MIEKPHSFATACNVATQAVAQIASSQYGGQSISLAHLVPFVQVSREKYQKEVAYEFEQSGIEADQDTINRVAEMRVRRGGQTGRSDDPVSGDHADDHQWAGSVHYGVYVSG